MKTLAMLGLTVLLASPVQEGPTFILSGEIKDMTGAFLVDAVVIIHAEGPPSPDTPTLPNDLTISPDPNTGRYSAELPVGIYYDVFFSRAGFMPECHVVYLPAATSRRKVELNLTPKIARRNCEKCSL
jgi:hypothetical protein